MRITPSEFCSVAASRPSWYDLPQTPVGQLEGFLSLRATQVVQKAFLESICWVCRRVVYQNGFADDFLSEQLIVGYGRTSLNTILSCGCGECDLEKVDTSFYFVLLKCLTHVENGLGDGIS